MLGDMFHHHKAQGVLNNIKHVKAIGEGGSKPKMSLLICYTCRNTKPNANIFTDFQNMNYPLSYREIKFQFSSHFNVTNSIISVLIEML